MSCCDQRFWVVDESGVGLTNALVKARKSVQTGFWEVTSDTTNGSAVLTLDEGDTYTATVTKSGYTSTPSSKTFKPCIGTINFTLKEENMADPKFAFYNPPYARCDGEYYNIGDTIEKPSGTSVTIYCDIKRTDYFGSAARARLRVHWNGCIQCTSSWHSYSPRETKSDVTCTVSIPTSTASATFYIDTDDVGQHDPRCCITLKPKAAKACINWIEPEKSTSVRVGDTVNCRIAMYNCGDALGNFYTEILNNGVRFTPNSCYNVWLEQYVENICSGSFVMPNRIVNLVFRGGHADGGSWKQDFSKSITLTPHGYCDQKFRVVDEDGVNIDNATVSVEFSHCTTYYGHCTVSDLEVGRSYRAISSKAGYDCLNCSKTFTACTSTITLTLKKKITTCNQSFIVKDTSGNTVTKNCIIVVREGGAWKNECATSTSGTCAVGLIKGTSLRACVEQVPSGYELTSDSCKSFTSCTSRITLKIKKSCTCTSWQAGECISTTHRRYTRTCTPSGCDTEVEDRPDITCAVCSCDSWIDGECVSNTHRAQTRTCTPAGCDIEYQEVPDPSCETIIKEPTTLSLEADNNNPNVGETVTFSGFLESWGIGVPNKSIEIYVDGVYSMDATTGSVIPELGYYNFVFAFDTPEEHTFQTKFIEDEVYYASESGEVPVIWHEEPAPCDQGFRVTVENIPTYGLTVQGMEKSALLSCDDPAPWAVNPIIEKSVTPTNPTITIDKQDGFHKPYPGEKWCFRVLDSENYVFDYLKPYETVPSTSCKSVSLNGWNGCKYYTLLTGPTEVLQNKPFQIKALLKEVPLKPVGSGYEVEFYETSLDTTPIWTCTTDEDGVALCTVPAKPTLGTYKYFAKLLDAPTFCEPITGLNIKVVEKLEPEGIWESIIQFISDTFGVEPEQAKIIAYAAIGLISLLFLSSMFKR